MKKIIPFIIILLILQNCGYSPMYGKNQKVNFYITKIDFDDGDFEISNFIKANLNNYFKENQGKKFNIESSVSFNKYSISKNSEGNTEKYELSCSVIFKIIHNNIEKEITINEKFKMNNLSDDFEEKKYERTIKQNMARLITSKLIFQLTKFDAS